MNTNYAYLALALVGIVVGAYFVLRAKPFTGTGNAPPPAPTAAGIAKGNAAKALSEDRP